MIRFPLLPHSIALYSRVCRRARKLTAAGDVAAAALVAGARVRALHRAQHAPSSTYHPTTVLPVHPNAIPCTTELRPPPLSSWPSTPATPGPATATSRRAATPATRRDQPRLKPLSVRETRATPACCRPGFGRRRLNSGDADVAHLLSH